MSDNVAKIGYPEATVRKYLSYIARQMQRRNRTVFMIEELQPDWLLSWWQRGLYLLLSRVLPVACFSTSIYIISGIYSFNAEFSREGMFSHLEWSQYIYDLQVYVVIGSIFALVDASWICLEKLLPVVRRCYQPVRFFLVIIIHTFAFLFLISYFTPKSSSDGILWLLLAPIWGYRRSRRTLETDIMPVEALGFFVSPALKGASIVLLVAFFPVFLFTVSSGYDSSVSNRLQSALVILTLAMLSGALFWGLRPKVRDSKTTPNQGIIGSVRNGLIYGSGAGFLVGFMFEYGLQVGSASKVAGDLDLISMLATAMQATYVDGSFIFTVLSMSLIGFLWFGGIDAIQHYVLRALLSVLGYLPIRLVRLLDYSTNELNFLQKVGGGYMFIHRYLLEHFAGEADQDSSQRKQAESV